jgi:4-amino-4-deoxy-L-arabinose transferase-like glycosyltransferase
MEPARTFSPAGLSLPFATRLPGLLLALLLVLACSFPVFAAQRARLTSDESLYAAEALNISLGRGPEYTTGRPVVHRAPFYPAMLAAVFEVAGPSLDTASWVSRIATALNAVLVLLIARKLAGTLAGLAAGTVAATSTFINGLGASLFLDTVESTFILASLLVLLHASSLSSFRPTFAAGALLGLAVITKESAVLLAPLPLCAELLRGLRPDWGARLLAWCGGLLATAAWWWVWVFAASGSIYLLGDPGNLRVTAVLFAAVGAAALIAAVIWRLGGKRRAPKLLASFALAFICFWGAAAVAALEWQSWEHSRNYLANVPAYVMDVLIPAFPTFPLMAVALVVTAFRLKDRPAVAWLLGAAGLYLPFVIFCANRGLALRDALPFLYFGAVALGCAAAWLVEWGRGVAETQGSRFQRLAGPVVVLAALAAVALSGLGRVARQEPALLQEDWDNVVARDTAAWIEGNVPPGTPLMSTRLYYSQVYFLTGGRYPIDQLPTVEVRITPDGPSLLAARSTLFRWEVLPARDRSAWLYLSYYSVKGYYVGLAEEDLLTGLRERGIQYLVVNASDAAFSSLAYLDYFDSNPAFTRVYEHGYTPIDSTVIYRVDLDRLSLTSIPLRVTRAAYSDLVRRVGPGLDEELDALSPAGSFEVVP